MPGDLFRRAGERFLPSRITPKILMLALALAAGGVVATLLIGRGQASAGQSHTVRNTGAPNPQASKTSPPTPAVSAVTAQPPIKFTSPPPAGVPAGLALKRYTGPTTITKNGTVIDGMDIQAPLRIAAANVIITRSLIHGTQNDFTAILVDGGSANISASTLSGTDDGIEGDNYTAVRVEVTKLGSDGFKLGNNVHIDQAWCHDDSPTPLSHADCVQMQSGVVNSSVTNSWLDGGTNSAIFLSPDLGPDSDGPVLINNNVLGNGTYTLYCVDGNHGEYYVKNITITNNRFLRNSRYGPASINVPVTVGNNTWFDTHELIGDAIR
jgi:hypothetical protein